MYKKHFIQKVAWGDIASGYCGLFPSATLSNKSSYSLQVRARNDNFAASCVQLVLAADTFDTERLAVSLMGYDTETGKWYKDYSFNATNPAGEIFNETSFRKEMFDNPASLIAPFVSNTSKLIACERIEGVFEQMYMPYFDISANYKSNLATANGISNAANVTVIKKAPSLIVAGDTFIVDLNPDSSLSAFAGQMITWDGSTFTSSTLTVGSLSHDGATGMSCYLVELQS